MATNNNLTLLVSPDGRDDSLSINQDVCFSTRSILASSRYGSSLILVVASFYVADGMCSVDGQILQAADMVYIHFESQVTIGGMGGELLYFDLPGYSA